MQLALPSLLAFMGSESRSYYKYFLTAPSSAAAPAE